MAPGTTCVIALLHRVTSYGRGIRGIALSRSACVQTMVCHGRGVQVPQDSKLTCAHGLERGSGL